MIVVDTSALIAVVFDEAKAGACSKALEADSEVLISAGTLAECLVVARRRHESQEVERLIVDLGMEIVNVTPASARRVAQAYERWGKGMHPAGLNFGDCFAYALAKEHSCPLLFIGNDFSKTDVASAL
jgi:ribonuclease VapC